MYIIFLGFLCTNGMVYHIPWDIPWVRIICGGSNLLCNTVDSITIVFRSDSLGDA